MVKNRELYKSKKFILAAAIIMIVILSSGGGLLFISNNRSTTDSEISKFSTCDDESFRVMVVDEGIIYSENTNKLRMVIDDVKETSSYKDSPNCNFLLTMYAINTGDTKAVSEYHSDLAKTYALKNGYTGALRDANLQTPDALVPVIDFMTKNRPSGGQAFEWDGKQPE
jgi:hypothetical protein